MNILMLTNVYTPFVGGVALSVERFVQAYREKGHSVLVVAPTFPDAPESEQGCVRVPAYQEFNGSDFSIALPIPMFLSSPLEKFRPDIVHSHHPFLLGDTALRISASHEIPLVFTHHTMYEHYLHYVPFDAERFGDFVVKLCTAYANLCDHIIAPSQSVKAILEARGVDSPITVIPTGVDTSEFTQGNGAKCREEYNVPEDAFVIGHVGRLAEEKNLSFLVNSVSEFMDMEPDVFFLVVGSGDAETKMQNQLDSADLLRRCRFLGKLEGEALCDAYDAMNLFAFSSKSETQGMVLMEAMAAGTPVVALDAPGVRDVVQHKQNGFLVEEESTDNFVNGLQWLHALDEEHLEKLIQYAKRTARTFDIKRCADQALGVYATSIEAYKEGKRRADEPEWNHLLELLRTEWHLWVNRFEAATTFFSNDT